MATSGLDLGGAGAAFVRLTARGTTVSLEAASLVALDAAADEASRAAAVAAGGDVGREDLTLGIGGRDAILRYLQLPNVPRWRLRLLMDVEVADVAEKAGEPLSADFRTLPMPEDLGAPDGMTVLVGLAKEAVLMRRLEALEGARAGVRAVLPTCVALFNAYVGLGHVDAGKTTVLVHAGPDASELAIVRDGFLVFARSLPTQREGAAVAALGPREAQHVAAAVGASIQFCKTQQKLRALPVDAVAVSGSFARSTELLDALRQALKVEVRTFDPLERLETASLPASSRAAIESRGPELAIAVGLALTTTHVRCVDLDLTPKPILARSEFRRRTVFLYAAGALLAAALAVSGVTAAIARKNVLARRADLAKALRSLEDRRDAVEAGANQNRRTIQVIDTLARRTQPGGAALRLIARLRDLTPPRVTITELDLEPPAGAPAPGGGRKPGSEAPPPSSEVAFRLLGEVDNAAGDAVAVLGRFEAALRDDGAVASAKVTQMPVAKGQDRLEFGIAVSMRAQARGVED
jgi:Tfp pilus assembly PilM family ATPase